MTKELAKAELSRHIKRLHNVDAEYLRTDNVTVIFNDQIVWESEVSVFKIGHDKTDTCFAWSSSVEGRITGSFTLCLKSRQLKLYRMR